MLTTSARHGLRRCVRRLASTRGFAAAASDGGELRETPLNALHKELGASMTDFGGWDMPLLYKDGGIMQEHKHCRAHAGLFDVSHMIPVRITGADRVAFAERVFPAGVKELPLGQGTLTNMPNHKGGLIDDCIITNASNDHLYVVINASHEDKDLPHMRAEMEAFDDVQMEVLTGRGMVALQGPDAAAVLQRHVAEDVDLSEGGVGPDAKGMSFMTGRALTVCGVDCFVTRSGYTGEDGFEILMPGGASEGIARTLLAEEEVMPIGLGARDSLRLEAGLCLYGNDIDDDTTPIEAGLTWTIGKRRRTEGGFVGADTILGQLKDKSLVTRKRVAFRAKGPPPRSHDKVFDMDGNEIGEITSGVFGPSIKGPVAMGYVKKGFTKSGTELQVEIRGKMRPLNVVKMPVVQANFFRK